MKFRSIAVPGPSEGVAASGKVLTVPDQSLGLAEIIKRFVRGEKLPVDMGGEYVEGPDDLEKVAHQDLTEKAEFIEKQKEKQARYKRQQEAIEAARKELERQKMIDAIRKEEAEKAANTANNTP